VSIKEKLKALQALQMVDLEISELQRAGEVYPKRLSELDAERATARVRVEAERNRLAENERLRRGKETEIQSEKEKIKKWEARLAEQRTTREYTALAREIDIAKKAMLNLEEELKNLVDQVESIKKALAEREGELNRFEDSSAAERAELESQISSLSSQVAALTEKRTGLSKEVDRELLSRYDSVRRANGSGMAAVVGGTCRGCNMRIRPQLYNILLAGSSIETCPSCNRLIYAAETLECKAE
jgi:predicted  nucleic acid-binding Zn-ribbon protein